MLGRRSVRTIAVAIVTVPLVLLTVGVASASHFRSSGSTVTVSGSTLTWDLNSAWRVGSSSYFETDNVGDMIGISQLSSAADAPGSGTNTGETLTLTSISSDTSNPLYTLTSQTFAGDVSALGDGIYEVYLADCCRVSGIENGTSDFSQWMRFTKSSGVINLPPHFVSPALFELIDPVTGITLNLPTADAEHNSTATAMITDISSPYYGSETIPCSSFSGGVFTISPTLCTGGDNFSASFTSGSFWSLKLSVTDSAGNQTIVDTLLRVAAEPDPYIDDDSSLGNGTSVEFTVLSRDTLVNSWTVTCVGVGDSSDVVTGTTTSNPASASAKVVLKGLSVGESYACEVRATNSIGSVESTDGYEIGPIQLSGVLLELDVAVGDHLNGAIANLSGGGLQANSDWTLVQHPSPITLASGVADGSGEFSFSLTLPAAACVPGIHTLTLTGVSSTGAAVTDQAWYQLAGDCTLLQFSRTGAVTPTELAVTPTELAATGTTLNPYLVAGGSASLMFGLGIILYVCRRLTQKS